MVGLLAFAQPTHTTPQMARQGIERPWQPALLRLTGFPAAGYNRFLRDNRLRSAVAEMTVHVASRRGVSTPSASPSASPSADKRSGGRLPCAGWYVDLVSGKEPGLKASLLRAGLSLLSVPYRLGVGVRNRLFDLGWKHTHRAGVPVISVGNLTLGGTGKSPAVEHVARFYRARGRRVALLSRGYGGGDGRNDEAMVLDENLPDVPHLQGADRVALAHRARQELKSDVLILDDGFQHRRLARDLDIVLIDATRPWGFDRLFPRGLLREPRKNLRRAGLVLLTRCDLIDAAELQALRAEVHRLAPGLPVVESVHRPLRLVNAFQETASLEFLGNQPVAAFCGLGNPEAFEQTLLQLGYRLTAFEVFPDHHRYSRGDVDGLRQWAQRLPADAAIVTSHKDLVKISLPELGGRPLWAVQIQLHITGGQDLLDHMLKGVMA